MEMSLATSTPVIAKKHLPEAFAPKNKISARFAKTTRIAKAINANVIDRFGKKNALKTPPFAT
jgi:hypothetical protein